MPSTNFPPDPARPLARKARPMTRPENVAARITDHERLPSVFATFGTFDAKGREHGHRVAIVRITFEADPAASMIRPAAWIGTKFHTAPQAMRDGKDFGASATTSRRVFDTLAEAQEYGAEVIDKARKARG
jgi:hypothetical protein